MRSEPVGGAELAAHDFPEFYRALHGREPFPWQVRLASELASPSEEGGRNGLWPHLLDLPTGSGKTTAIEIAVFMMALRDDAPRRVVIVVDRRVIVQQAFSVAEHLARRLQDGGSDEGVIGVVARRLRAFTDTAPRPTELPLVVAELRGGIDIDEAWTRRPDAPAVIVSTVDQVGSRLLMQGYGVSPRMRPVHAGLLANDVLFLLDEVHLARPFAQTLDAVSRLRHQGDRVWVDGGRWQVSRLSATPGAATDATQPFRLTDEDRAGALGSRLSAHKRATCVTVRAPADLAKQSAALAKELARQALELHRRREATVIGIVANRVATASAVAARLRDAMGAAAGSTVVLLTGRMRPYDRDRAMEQFGARLRSGRVRAATDEPLFLVGTQAVEVGADFDVDVLVTECASLDALKQRFGRVNRLGQLAATGTGPTSLIVASDRIDKDADAVYGTASAATWQWINGLDALDFGVDYLPAIPRAMEDDMLAPTKNAPALMPSHLDRWWQTTEPDALPDVANWLHGPQDQDPDVTVVWRSGLDHAGLAEGDEATTVASEMVTAVPLTSAEGVSVPLARVRRWLDGASSDAFFADVEGLPGPDDVPQRSAEVSPWLIWRPDNPLWTADAWRIRPGDTVVVDASRGGLSLGTWDPSATEPVTDVSIAIAAGTDDHVDDGDGTHYVRLLPALFPGDQSLPVPLTVDQPGGPAGDLLGDDASDELDDDALVRRWCEDVASSPLDGPERGPGLGSDLGQLRWLVENHRLESAEIHRMGLGAASWYLVKWVHPGARASLGVNAGANVSSAIGHRVTLDQHLRDTAQWATAFVASGGGLTPTAARAVVDAARWHDLGKVDGRFQCQLRDGTLDGTTSLLAKSLVPSWDRGRWERARRDAGYPRGERHEMFSVRMLDHVLEESDQGDWDLVRYLVGAHHGHGRPFVMPAGAGAEPRPLTTAVLGCEVAFEGTHGYDRVDSAVPQRFWTTLRTHGWFATVWLEALMRLADHRASEFPGVWEEAGHEPDA